ncbi:hypothetical protein EB796_013746 [Bugula neritina]|uniref:CCHC-type domain-containing protein n=1 Tax=Bugula neritina TaxID=10212 RepID=A0A7J7JR61_BUGNE|nr:hypothetical protein EB796_013746 [Bugula neritina]
MSGKRGNDDQEWKVKKKKGKREKPVVREESTDSEEGTGTTKSYLVKKDGKETTVTAVIITRDDQPRRVLYGNRGKLNCMLCRAKRDYIAAQCPGHFCHKCREHGHWARDCPRNTQCRWCHSNEHQVEECPLGGRTFTTTSVKRSAEEVKTTATPTGPEPAKVARLQNTTRSYASAVSNLTTKSKPVTSTHANIGSFIESFSNFKEEDLRLQIEIVKKEREIEMRRHEAKMAELAKKEKEALRTLRNHSKLQSILAQLKDVQEDMETDGEEEVPTEVPSAIEEVPTGGT